MVLNPATCSNSAYFEVGFVTVNPNVVVYRWKFYIVIPFANLRRDRPSCSSSTHDQTPNSPHLWLASLLEEEAINSMDYEFNFQLEIRAPYLLAGQRS